MTQVEKSDFQGLIQAEGSRSGAWFVPGEVLVEDRDECYELVAGEPGCTMVLQQSFPA